MKALNTSAPTPRTSAATTTSIPGISSGAREPVLIGLERLEMAELIDDILIENGLLEEESVEVRDSLPPSYSQVEGLDNLPEYEDVEARRLSFGNYKIVLDKKCSRVVAFKEPSGKQRQNQPQEL